MAEARLNLVTGACGFVGTHLVRRLLAAGESVIATDLAGAFEHPKTRFITERLGLDFRHPRCTVQPCDLTDAAAVAQLFARPVTHVFHTASLYDYSAELPLLRRINVGGAVNLFEAALRCRPVPRFIHWSTCGVFGKPYTAAMGRCCNVPFCEASPSPKNTAFGAAAPAGTHLVNDYSITKWEQEQLAWQCHRERGLPLTVIRPAPVYGPGSDYGHGGIVLALNQGFGRFLPRDARNYITTSVHVEDVAGFAQFVADRPETVGEDYNVVDDSILSYAEFLHYIALLLGRRVCDVPLVYMPLVRRLMVGVARLCRWLERHWGLPRMRMIEVGSTTYMASSYWIANDKSNAAGYAYQYPDVKAGLRETVAWFRDAGWLAPDYHPRAAWKQVQRVR